MTHLIFCTGVLAGTLINLTAAVTGKGSTYDGSEQREVDPDPHVNCHVDLV